MHRTRSDRAKRICRLMKEIGSESDPNLEARLARVGTMLSNYADRVPEATPVVISDENICGHALLFWRGRDIGPAELARRIGALQRVTADRFPVLRVIIGVRRQDQWLASRYAESSTVFKTFGQADFDHRIAEIMKQRPFSPGFEWLDYHCVQAHFSRTLGEENVLIMSMERLRAEPASALAELGRFVGAPAIEDRYQQLLEEDIRIERNILSAGSDTWLLRRDGSELRLTQELRDLVLARVADSNRELGNRIPLYF